MNEVKYIAGMSIGELALQVAISQLGQEERPAHDNHGPMVDEYLKSVGLNPGYAWCQGFVHWCYQQAALIMGQACPVLKTAGVLDCWNRTDAGIKHTASEIRHKTDKILPGAQFIMDYGKGQGHTGIVEKVEGLFLHTIEGNTNDGGSREGYEVCRKKRSLSELQMKGIIIYS